MKLRMHTTETEEVSLTERIETFLADATGSSSALLAQAQTLLEEATAELQFAKPESPEGEHPLACMVKDLSLNLLVRMDHDIILLVENGSSEHPRWRLHLLTEREAREHIEMLREERWETIQLDPEVEGECEREEEYVDGTQNGPINNGGA